MLCARREPWRWEGVGLDCCGIGTVAVSSDDRGAGGGGMSVEMSSIPAIFNTSVSGLSSYAAAIPATRAVLSTPLA